MNRGVGEWNDPEGDGAGDDAGSGEGWMAGKFPEGGENAASVDFDGAVGGA